MIGPRCRGPYATVGSEVPPDRRGMVARDARRGGMVTRGGQMTEVPHSAQSDAVTQSTTSVTCVHARGRTSGHMRSRDTLGRWALVGRGSRPLASQLPDQLAGTRTMRITDVAVTARTQPGPGPTTQAAA